MKNKFSRYTFTFLESVNPSVLAKLMAISDKVFIFLPHNAQSVPVQLVSIAQKKGKDLKWVASAGENTLQSTLSFSLGVWHERSPLEIEFIVASNEELLDPFINFINAVGRKCTRVNVDEATEIKVAVHQKLENKNGFQLQNSENTSGLSSSNDESKHISIEK